MSTHIFDAEGFIAPDLPSGLKVVDVPVFEATDENLKGLGRVFDSRDEISVENGNFEIVPWPVSGWRKLDPDTGDEAGTTEGMFEVSWQGDFFCAQNHAVNTVANKYLDGLSALPEDASGFDDKSNSDDNIYLWYSDYHPDGGQLFWCENNVEFTVCLGPASKGDDITPEDMKAFHVPAGKGVYIHPGTWHNGVYTNKKHGEVLFMTRQGKVHARVSASWAHEFGTILRVPLSN